MGDGGFGVGDREEIITIRTVGRFSLTSHMANDLLEAGQVMSQYFAVAN